MFWLWILDCSHDLIPAGTTSYEPMDLHKLKYDTAGFALDMTLDDATCKSNIVKRPVRESPSLLRISAPKFDRKECQLSGKLWKKAGVLSAPYRRQCLDTGVERLW